MSNTLEVIQIIQETPESRSITFKIPNHLKEVYKFLPGQYVTLVFEIDGVKHKRCYSISSCPFTEADLTIAAKRVKGGLISNYLNDSVKVGDLLTVEKPMGNFKIKVGGMLSFNTYVFLAGGSGITPVVSMIESVLLKESFAKVVLLYGNSDVSNIIYKEKLAKLQTKYAGKFTLVHVLQMPPADWTGESGLMSQQTCQALLQKYVKSVPKSKYYICGPQAMMDEVLAGLKTFGVGQELIHLEYFTALPQNTEVVEEIADVQDSSKKQVIAWIDGKRHELTLNKKENIIAGAIRANIDPPYSCRTGACSSCIAKLLKGKVHMDVTTGLTQKEVEDGYILCCQSHPVTAEVEVEFVNY